MEVPQDSVQIQISSNDDLEKKIDDLRREFLKMREEQSSQVSQGFVKGNNPQPLLPPKQQINVSDTEIFSKSPPPPVSLQAGNLEVLTQLTDPSKLLLSPQRPSNDPKELYVTVIKKKKNNEDVLKVTF